MKNAIVNINNQAVSIKEYKEQRVVTLKDIDTVHNRPEGTARRNLNENKKHLIEDVDFFFVKPKDVEAYEIRTSEINNSGTYLLTESGYLMLVKSFTDDLAWSVQRQLVNSYFRIQAEKTGQPTAYHMALAESKVKNARSREASMWLKIADRIAVPEYKQICASYASSALAGHEVIPLPTSEQRYLQAREIGKMLGISANMVGRLAKAHGLKTEAYGKWFHDKASHCSKEVDTFRYNDAAIEKFREILDSMGAQ